MLLITNKLHSELQDRTRMEFSRLFLECGFLRIPQRILSDH
jgi:hypothetical protein